MKIKDLMSANPVLVRGDETCRDVASRMCQRHVRHLPVVNREDLLEGVITDRDLRHYLLSPSVIGQLGRVPVTTLLEHVRVRDVMSWPVFVTSPETDLVDAVKLMRVHHVGALPVVEGRQVLGIVTETDLLRQIVAADTTVRDEACIIVSYP
jgi:acetoin utilization protein AcuB